MNEKCKGALNMVKEKRKIPHDVQKKMIDFFMRTSIPRKKYFLENIKNTENKNHLPIEKEDR
jgi:hypothetical protein